MFSVSRRVAFQSSSAKPSYRANLMSVTGSRESWLNPPFALPVRKLAKPCASFAPEFELTGTLGKPVSFAKRERALCSCRIVFQLLIVVVAEAEMKSLVMENLRHVPEGLVIGAVVDVRDRTIERRHSAGAADGDGWDHAHSVRKHQARFDIRRLRRCKEARRR